MGRNSKNKDKAKFQGQSGESKGSGKGDNSDQDSKKRKINEIAQNSSSSSVDTSLVHPSTPLPTTLPTTISNIDPNIIRRMALQIDKLESEVFDLKNMSDRQQKDIEILTSSNTDLFLELEKQRHIVQTLTHTSNDHEQYMRHNSVRIFGVTDNDPREPLHITEQIVRDLLKTRLGLNFGPGEFDICHRIGKFSEGSKRVIIVKFICRKSKIVTLANRRKLARSGISISEDLTAKNVKRLHEIKNLTCVQQSWSRDGRLFAKDHNNFVKEVKVQDLLSERLFAKRSAEPPTPHDSAAQEKQQQVPSEAGDSGSKMATTSDIARNSNDSEANRKTGNNNAEDSSSNNGNNNNSNNNDNSGQHSKTPKMNRNSKCNDIGNSSSENSDAVKVSSKGGGGAVQSHTNESRVQPPKNHTATDASDKNNVQTMDFTNDDVTSRKPVSESTPKRFPLQDKLTSLAEG